MNLDESFSITSIWRHAWLMFVIITFANAAVWWVRSRAEIAKNPALEWGYRRLIRGYLIFGTIPWLILGAALELPGAFSGPLFIAFGVTVVVYWIASLYWLLFRGGAEDIAAHPGIWGIWRGSFRDPWVRDPRTIKVQAVGLISVLFVGTVLIIGFFILGGAPPNLRH